MTSPDEKRFDFVPTHLAVKAMRDNGYKNAAYAVAELIDNSIQAGATAVELLCTESEEQLAQRRRRRIEHIAVLDNGKGMDAATLRMALQFGNGTHLEDRTGIGRFGMGLPSASISQCRRVEVWTWESGVENSIFTCLDLGSIERGESSEVPVPVPAEVPQFWKSAGQSFGRSGTLVVWSDLDRCTWRTAKTVINNSELIIGRMYRKFIHDGTATIRLATFVDGDSTPETDDFALVNDPLYRMAPSSTPTPYSNKAMFDTFGDHWEVRPRIFYEGADHEVVIRFTMASLEARTPSQTGEAAGNMPHGMHARRNVGISLTRAGRELDLDQSWVVSSEARERWWGVEVEFPPGLDEIFGVTNNKQAARYFSSTLDIAELLDGQNSVAQIREEYLENEDPSGPLIDIADTIMRNLRQIRRQIIEQARHTEKRTRRRHEPDSPEAKGTRATKDRQGDGIPGASDGDESMPEGERIQSIEDELIERGMPEPQAKELAARTVTTGMKYAFSQGDLETPAFFSVRTKGGALIITLNTNHPAYNHLMAVLDAEDQDNLSPEELNARLNNAWRGLRLLLEAWARYEDEQPDGTLRQRVQDARNDWGRVARQFLDEG